MATSGTSSYSRNRDQIIKAAGRKVGAFEAGETPDSETVTDFAEALNAWVKHEQGRGNLIWTTAEATLFLQADQTRYVLGATDHATESFVSTTLSAAGASGATSLSITSATGMSASDNVGIVLDDGSIHWTTISGAPSTTLTIASGLASAAASGALVFAYTTRMVRPLRIMSARRYNFASALDTPIDVEDRETYFDLPNKTGTGVPNLIFYDRRGGANATGLLYTWQPQASITEAIKFTWARPIQIFSAAGNDQDFPDEWVQTLIFNLAVVMAPEYNVPEQRLARLQNMADKYLAEVTWNEAELGGFSLVPDLRP
jgi:hypothetical protein